jgi:hypothetical protein
LDDAEDFGAAALEAGLAVALIDAVADLEVARLVARCDASRHAFPSAPVSTASNGKPRQR